MLKIFERPLSPASVRDFISLNISIKKAATQPKLDSHLLQTLNPIIVKKG
jgi:hypothetical protein